MFKQISNLAGNEIYLLISLIIFIVFFAIATFVMLKMKKSHINYMSDIPLKEDEPTKL